MKTANFEACFWSLIEMNKSHDIYNFMNALSVARNLDLRQVNLTSLWAEKLQNKRSKLFGSQNGQPK